MAGDVVVASDASLLAWGIFTRALAIVFVIALTSLGWRDQLVALSGERGITPLSALHTTYVNAYGAWGAMIRYPSIYWFIGSSDAALRWTPCVGAASAFAVALGVVQPSIGLGFAWFTFLSVDVGSSFTGAIFPWDCLLLEVGALCLWLRPLAVFPSLVAVAPASPLLAFTFRFLLFRVLIGFGKLKFWSANWRRDANYIRGFLVNMPIVHPFGYFLHRTIPRAAFPSFLAGMAITVLIAPWGLFWTGLPRLAAVASIIGLMFGVQITGNFGHFNILSAALALPSLIDPASSITDFSWSDAARTPRAAAETTYLCAALAIAMLYFPANSWVNLSIPFWPVWDRINSLRGLFAGLRAIAPLRAVSTYGVFGPAPAPAQRWVPVYEGSNDGGETWREYAFRYYPTHAMSPPVAVAPHHPRLDHSLVYDSIGLDGHSPLGLLNHGNAFGFTRTPTAMRLALRLLEGASPAIRALFAVDPFPNAPPSLIRVRLRVMRPAPLGAAAWWRADDVATHIGAFSLDGPLGSTPRLDEKPGAWAAARWAGWLPRGSEDLWFEAARERSDAWPGGESERAASAAADEAELWRSVERVRAWTVAAALDAAGDDALPAPPLPLHAMRLGTGSRQTQIAAESPPSSSSASLPKAFLQLNDAARAALQLAPSRTATARRTAALAVSAASLDEAIDVDTGDAVFTWRHLPSVVGMARTARGDTSREESERATRRALLPALCAAERVWWRPAPDAATLRAEITAYEIARTKTGAGSEAWAPLEAAVQAFSSDIDIDEWQSRYMRLSAVDAAPLAVTAGEPIRVENVEYDVPTAIFGDNDDSPGADGAGAMRNHMRLAFFVHWRALFGGRAAFSPLLSALRDARVRKAAPLPLLFRALAPRAIFDPSNAATESSSFLWAVHGYDWLAAAGEKAWIVASTMKPPRVTPVMSASIAPAFTEIMPRAAAHYIHASLRPLDENRKPRPIAWVPSYCVLKDGDFEEINEQKAAAPHAHRSP